MEIEIILIAGEASGDLLGARLMKKLKEHAKNSGVSLKFSGVGGQNMIHQGLETIFDIQELSVMGFSEIIPQIPNLLKRIKNCVDFINSSNAKMIITIDSPSFCFRVMSQVKTDAFKIHYVAPTVWAMGASRAKKIAKIYDLLAVLLPFEPPYFELHGLRTIYVGHPAVEDFSEFQKNADDQIEFKKKHSIPANHKIVTMMPGSRKTEINRLMPVFVETVNLLKHRHPLTVVIVTLPHLVGILQEMTSELDVKAIFCTAENKIEAFKASDIGLIKSGTSTLEVALAQLPHIVAYKVSWLTAQIVKYRLKVKFVNLINLIANEEIIPEFLQKNCEATQLAFALNSLLSNPQKCEKQIVKSQKILKMLGLQQKPEPSEKLVNEILMKLL